MSDDDLILCSEDSDGIIGSRHFMRKNYQTKLREPSNTVVLTFKSIILPRYAGCPRKIESEIP